MERDSVREASFDSTRRPLRWGSGSITVPGLPSANSPAQRLRSSSPLHTLRLTAQRALSAYAEAQALEKELRGLVKATAPVLLAQPGVGPVTAARC
jgi:hypothetical protein